MRPARAPVLGRNVVATSQQLAAQAGLRMLLKGGNAIDAAIAAAMTLTVVEPSGNGIGSDAFAIVWDGKRLATGSTARADRRRLGRTSASPDIRSMPQRGWESVTVPGAVSSWVALSRRFGKLPFATLAEPAISYAREGFRSLPSLPSCGAAQASSCAISRASPNASSPKGGR